MIDESMYTSEYEFVLIYTPEYIDKKDSFLGPHIHFIKTNCYSDRDESEATFPSHTLHSYGTAYALEQGLLSVKILESARKTSGLTVGLGGTSYGNLLKSEAFINYNVANKITYEGEHEYIKDEEGYSFLQAAENFYPDITIKLDSANDPNHLIEESLKALTGEQIKDIPFIARGIVCFLRATLHARTVNDCNDECQPNDTLEKIVYHQHNFSRLPHHDESEPIGGHLVSVKSDNDQPGMLFSSAIEIMEIDLDKFIIYENSVDSGKPVQVEPTRS
jgi:hypothetical protein